MKTLQNEKCIIEIREDKKEFFGKSLARDLFGNTGTNHMAKIVQFLGADKKTSLIKKFLTVLQPKSSMGFLFSGFSLQPKTPMGFLK